MDEIQDRLLLAWKRIEPQLLKDPAELQKRLARRSSAIFKRPPREWCLTLRANDTRLDSYLMDYPSQRDATRVLIDTHALHLLCAPVHIQSPGESVHDVAARLGVHHSKILTARLHDRFEQRYIPGLDGKPGPPQVLIHTHEPLNPANKLLRPPDDVWSFSAAELAWHVPGGLSETLTRVPLYRSRTKSFETQGLHPEHPRVDTRVLSEVEGPIVDGVEQIKNLSTGKRTRRLAPPPGDIMAWYKYKDGVFVGYDVNDPDGEYKYHRSLEKKAKRREYSRRYYYKTYTSKSKGSLEFKGYLWICPKCQCRCRNLLLPVSNASYLAGALDRVESLTGQWLTTIDFDPHFACEICIRPMGTSRSNPDFLWNRVVMFLSSGLLYGHEVERPDWLEPKRERPFTTRPGRAPSKRVPQVEALLLQGLTFPQIAKQLNLGKTTVRKYGQRVYENHGAKTVKEFLQKIGLTEEQRQARLTQGKFKPGHTASKEYWRSRRQCPPTPSKSVAPS